MQTHAGSGKTVCGEAAVYAGLALGKRVLYTTPLKALSNQKFYDFKKQFGPGEDTNMSNLWCICSGHIYRRELLNYKLHGSNRH